MLTGIIIGILAALLAVVFVRTLTFKPKAQPAVSEEQVIFDKDGAVDALAELVRCKTISNYDHSLEEEAEFEKLIAKLPRLYPHVFAACDFRQLPDRALLFCWPGKRAGDPAVLMAHYDVVPVNEDQWEKPAFEATIEDGVMTGDLYLLSNLENKKTVNSREFLEEINLRLKELM